MSVERYWVSEFHPGEPVNECKPAYIEMVEAADYDALRATLARALHLLWIGMEVGLDPVEKDEATALFVKYGDGEAFTGSLHEIIGVDMAKGPDVTVTHRPPQCPECGLFLDSRGQCRNGHDARPTNMKRGGQ